MSQTRSEILNNLVSKICSAEGGAKQLDAGQAREVMSKIVQLIKKDDQFSKDFLSYLIGVKIDQINEFITSAQAEVENVKRTV